VGGCIWRNRATSRSRRKAAVAAAAATARQQQQVADLQLELRQLRQQHQPVNPPVYQEQAEAAALPPQLVIPPSPVPEQQQRQQRQHRRGDGTDSERRGLLSSTRHRISVAGGPLAEATGTAIRKSGRKMSRGAVAVTNYGKQLGKFLVLSPAAREAHLEAVSRQERMAWRRQEPDHHIDMGGFANVNYDPAGVDALPPPPSPWNRPRAPHTPPPPPPPPPPPALTAEEMDAIRHRRLEQHFLTRAQIQVGVHSQPQQQQSQQQQSQQRGIPTVSPAVDGGVAASASATTEAGNDDDDSSSANRGARRKMGTAAAPDKRFPLRRLESPESSEEESRV
jgi:hypothetical protein